MRVSDADILILPGAGDAGADHWQSRWLAKLSTGRSVAPDDWSDLSRDAWVAQIVEAVRATERPCVLVPHGLAVIAAAHAAPALGPRVKGAFLVAPSATLETRAFSSEVGTGSREENAIRPKAGAFSSEVGTGSREENAKGQSAGACSSEVGAGSREENAMKQRAKAFPRFGESRKYSGAARDFEPVPLVPLPFPSVLVASRNDPFCTPQRAADLAEAWGSEFVDAGDAGHIDVASGHGPWPEGLMRFAGFLSKLARVRLQ